MIHVCYNISKIFHGLQKYLVKQSKITLKMNTLFNSEAYSGCLERTLTSQFHIYHKSMAQSSFLTHIFLMIVPSMLKAALKPFKWLSSFIYIEHFYKHVVFHAVSV